MRSGSTSTGSNPTISNQRHRDILGGIVVPALRYDGRDALCASHRPTEKHFARYPLPKVEKTLGRGVFVDNSSVMALIGSSRRA